MSISATVASIIHGAVVLLGNMIPRRMADIKSLVLYKHKGRYCYRYHRSDPALNELGLALLREVPTRAGDFDKWLEDKQSWCDEIMAASPAGGESLWKVLGGGARPDSHDEPCLAWIAWVYEFDLDFLFFKVDDTPIFRLDNMPPESTFISCVAIDHYGFYAPAEHTPWAHNAFSRPPAPPIVLDSALDVFRECHSGAVPVQLHTLLSRLEKPSNRERVCTKMLEITIGFLMEHVLYHPSFRDAPLIPDVGSIPQMTRKIMLILSRLGTCPLYYHTELQHYIDSEHMEPFWWIREHICVRPSTHLNDERNLHYAISDLISKIAKTAGPDIVFGVAFSLVHIAIVRVDKNGGNSVTFQYTNVFDFLPSRYATNSSTPGITALVRLGDLPTGDDHSFFRSVLCGHHNVRVLVSSGDSEFIRNSSISELPLEILVEIASYIDNALDLNRFALLSHATMIAAIRWLKYPQIWAQWYSKDQWPKNADSQRSGSLLVRAVFDELLSDRESEVPYSHLWAGRFQALLEGEQIEFYATEYPNVDVALGRFLYKRCCPGPISIEACIGAES